MSDEVRSLKGMLEHSIKKASKVFIVGHNDPDFDAIGSAIGLQVIATILGKESYIVVDDTLLQPGVKKIIESGNEKFNIITKEEFLRLRDKDSVLIMTDVNKDYLISLKDYLKEFKEVVIVDHHCKDKGTVETKESFIDPKASSASELVTHVLSTYKTKRLTPCVANALLSGIVLDTKRFSQKTTAKTYDAVKKLVLKGADMEFINKLFLREFAEDKRLNDLVFNGTEFRLFEGGLTENRNIAFIINRSEPRALYRREEIAKASDKLLKYSVDAVFALGYVDEETVAISARSKSDIDVSQILSKLTTGQGGGNPENAGALSKENIFTVEQDIIERTKEYLDYEATKTTAQVLSLKRQMPVVHQEIKKEEN